MRCQALPGNDFLTCMQVHMMTLGALIYMPRRRRTSAFGRRWEATSSAHLSAASAPSTS